MTYPMRASSQRAADFAMAESVAGRRELVRAALVKALNDYIGRGLEQTALETVLRRTGIPSSTLKAYKAGEAAPTIGNLFELMSVLGDGFVGELMGKIGYGAYRLPGESELDPHQVLAAASRGAASVAEALAGDGRVDHREAMPLARKARELGALLSEFAEELEARVARMRRGA